MNILFDISHPAHVHLFRASILKLQKEGHKTIVAARKVNSIIDLLDAYDIPHITIGKKYNNILSKYFIQIIFLIKLLWLAKRHKIDIGLGVSMSLPIVSRYTKMKVIGLDDDDACITPVFAKYVNQSDTVLTPESLVKDNRGSHHITYKGFHELAYLHPARFSPDESILQYLNLQKDEKYFILRFNAFKAHHDVGEHGMNIDQKHQLIKLLEPYGRVFISSESNDDEFRNYKLNLPPEKIHSVLYYASMFIGDSQTMTSEAAVLGTPALKCNTFAGRLSVPNELENEYELCYSFQPKDFDKMLNKITELLENHKLQTEFQTRRQKMLSEKIDVTDFMVWFIENYPDSIRIVKENPGIQEKFK